MACDHLAGMGMPDSDPGRNTYKMSQDSTARRSWAELEESAFWPEGNQSSWAATQMGGHPRTPSKAIAAYRAEVQGGRFETPSHPARKRAPVLPRWALAALPVPSQHRWMLRRDNRN